MVGMVLYIRKIAREDLLSQKIHLEEEEISFAGRLRKAVVREVTEKFLISMEFRR